MGITNLNTIITEHAPNARIKIPMKNFASCKIAIDGNGWMYTYMAAARKKVINETNLAAYDPCENAIRKEWFGFLINFVLEQDFFVGWSSPTLLWAVLRAQNGVGSAHLQIYKSAFRLKPKRLIIQ